MQPQKRPSIMASKSSLAARVWLGMARVLCVCALTTGCKHPPDEPQVVNARFLELYSLSPSPDEEHTIAVNGPRGNLWYRSAGPVLNLNDFRLGETYTYENKDGTYTVVFIVKRALHSHLNTWATEHVGRNIGWMVDGHLAHVAELKVAVTDRIGIDGFSTSEQAERLARAVERGGVPVTGP